MGFYSRFLFILIFSTTLFGSDLKKDSFDVNDVSILFAKNKSHMKPYPEIVGNTGDLLPATLLSDLVSFAHTDMLPQGSGRLVLHSAARKNDGWFVQGFRVDDCAPKDGQKESITEKTCEYQLRLVLQPIEKATDQNFRHLNLGFLGNNKGEELITDSFDVGDLTTTDNALHLIYGLQKTEFETMLTSLQQIKLSSPVKTSGVPLGVHPGLLSELKTGTTDAFAKKVSHFVTTFAQPKQLRRVTFFGPTNRVWVFMGGKVFQDTNQKWRWEVTAMSNVGDSKVQIADIGLGLRPALTVINKGRVSRDKTESMTPKEGETIEMAKKRVLSSVASLLNSRAIHAENVDCGSCHAAGLDLWQHSGNFNKTKVAEIIAEETFQELPKGVTPFLSFAKEVSTGYSQISFWNLRSFGYYFGHPIVSFRTLTESLRVASRLNQTYQLESSVKACSSKEKYAEALEKFGSIHSYAEEAKFIDSCAVK